MKISKMKKKVSTVLILSILIQSLPFTFSQALAKEVLELWPYVENSAVEEQKERQTEAYSYLIGGAVAIGFPLLTTSSDSPLRDVAMFTLVPAGFISILYGGYTLMTDSPRMKVKKRIERLAGEEDEDDTQWKLRREANARKVLLEEGETARFWRYFWGGVGAGAGIGILANDQSAGSLVVSGLLLGLASYQFFHKRSDERIMDNLERTAVGWNGFGPDKMISVGYRFSF